MDSTQVTGKIPHFLGMWLCFTVHA